MKKRAVILFPNHHLAYSPTTINLYDELNADFEVEIVAPFPKKFNNQQLNDYKVNYFEDNAPSIVEKGISLFLWVMYILIGKGKIYSYQTVKDLRKYTKLFREVKKSNPSLVVATDIIFMKAASRIFEKVVFVSLEINDKLIPLLKSIPDNKFEAVIIQSEERFQYLFQNSSVQYFIIQNSVKNMSPPKEVVKYQNTIIYNGTFSETFGGYSFLNFIKQFNNEYIGYVKGAILADDRKNIENKYGELIQKGGLILDDGYLSSEELIEKVSEYYIGVCFYDINNITENRFNYLSAPSGKMFTYLAAGVPVIGSKISGLSIIENYQCGVLIEDYSPDSIRYAIKQITQNYAQFKLNCYNAAKAYNFEVMAMPFMQYLQKKYL